MNEYMKTEKVSRIGRDWRNRTIEAEWYPGLNSGTSEASEEH